LLPAAAAAADHGATASAVALAVEPQVNKVIVATAKIATQVQAVLKPQEVKPETAAIQVKMAPLELVETPLSAPMPVAVAAVGTAVAVPQVAIVAAAAAVGHLTLIPTFAPMYHTTKELKPATEN
jgi:hypothetical protein